MSKVAKESKFLLSSGGTNYFYVNRKNKKKSKGETKLSVKKYDPILRKHVLFEDKKLSKKKKAQAPKQVDAAKVDAEAVKPDAVKKTDTAKSAPKPAKKEAAKK